jgi:hypothetical protein
VDSEADYRRTEFAGLRSEIDRRSSEQFLLLALSLTAFTTLVGIAGAKDATKSARELLVLAPWLSSLAGLLWLDHDRSIHAIGRYIGQELWPGHVPSFERHRNRFGPSALTAALGFLVPVLLVFLSPAGYALVATQGEFQNTVLWRAGVAAIVLFVAAGVVGFVSRHRSTVVVVKKGR